MKTNWKSPFSIPKKRRKANIICSTMSCQIVAKSHIIIIHWTRFILVNKLNEFSSLARAHTHTNTYIQTTMVHNDENQKNSILEPIKLYLRKFISTYPSLYVVLILCAYNRRAKRPHSCLCYCLNTINEIWFSVL